MIKYFFIDSSEQCCLQYFRWLSLQTEQVLNIFRSELQNCEKSRLLWHEIHWYCIVSDYNTGVKNYLRLLNVFHVFLSFHMGRSRILKKTAFACLTKFVLAVAVFATEF